MIHSQKIDHRSANEHDGHSTLDESRSLVSPSPSSDSISPSSSSSKKSSLNLDSNFSLERDFISILTTKKSKMLTTQPDEAAVIDCALSNLMSNGKVIPLGSLFNPITV